MDIFYTVFGKLVPRNYDKFPEPKKFIEFYKENGISLVANIKPCLLKDHPLYDDVAKKGLLLTSADTQAPAITQWWGGLGSYLDFTKLETISWWKEHVISSLLEFGITSTWNDNNEYEVLSPNCMAYMFGRPCKAMDIKPLFGLLMMRASLQAQLEFANSSATCNDKQPRQFLVSRAG